ncbi:hypothetical protein Tco_0037671, partial [Tanacetum coccineum]
VRIRQKSQENRQKLANTDTRNGRAQKKPGIKKENHTWTMRKHKEVEDFTLELLSKEAQPVTITNSHASNPCELEIDLTAKSNSPIIEGMYGQDWKERVTEFGPRSFRRRL